MSNVFVYADDLIILTPTITALKHLVNICEDYGSEIELKFNHDKCYLLTFADKSIYEFNNIIVKTCGARVKVVERGVHLGHNY